MEKVYILIQWFKLIPNIMFYSKHIAPGPVSKKEIVVNTSKQDAPQEKSNCQHNLRSLGELFLIR